MRIPNANDAIVDIDKLTGYCLNSHHSRGKHKARVFESACGITAVNAEILRLQLLDAVVERDARELPISAHGKRYMVEFTLQGPAGAADVRSAWIIRDGEEIPRFVSAYVI